MPVGSVEDPSPGRSLSRLVGFRPPRSPVRSPETSVPEVAPVRSLKRLLQITERTRVSGELYGGDLDVRQRCCNRR